jgi:hypothetical protein
MSTELDHRAQVTSLMINIQSFSGPFRCLRRCDVTRLKRLSQTQRLVLGAFRVQLDFNIFQSSCRLFASQTFVLCSVWEMQFAFHDGGETQYDADELECTSWGEQLA